MVFKNNEAPEECLTQFKKEPTVSVICRRCLFLEDPIKDYLELDDQYLNVTATVEPDQI